MEIANMKQELNQALKNKRPKEMLNLDWLVNGYLKQLAIYMSRKALRPTRAHSIKEVGITLGKQPQLAHGAGQTLEPSVTHYFCKDKGHMKENCIKLDMKTALRCKIRKTLLWLPKCLCFKCQKLVTSLSLNQSTADSVHGPDWIDIQSSMDELLW